MNIECLANELIIEIFEYFNTIELLRSFHQLNIRFNQLLSLHFEKCPLDFRRIFKEDFDYICTHHLPFITNQITSIHLSNEDETPNQPQLFFSYGFHFQQFSRLQSLSLYHLHSTYLLNQIIVSSPQLIYLNISKCHFDDDVEQGKICMKNIWSLINLQSCDLNEIFIPTETIISSSLRELSLQNHPLTFDCFTWLFDHTPYLQTLNIQIRDFSNEIVFSSIIPSLTKLNLDFGGEVNVLRTLLKNLPNLSKLIIEISGIYIDGYQWEELIRNSLPKLTIFRLKMLHQFDQTKTLDEQLEELIESFQTKFWIEDHQWFIRCHCCTAFRNLHLYTLPYAFEKFSYGNGDLVKSTCPIERNDRSFNHVKTLLLVTDLPRSELQFRNIQHLEIGFPFDQTIWSLIPRFDRLTSLEIVSIDRSDELDQSIIRPRQLLDGAISLRSLTIDYIILSQLSTIRTTNPSIHRLDLMRNDGHFYGLECISYIQSFLGYQCEVLLINLEHRSIVLQLIEEMPKLRAFIFQCQDDQWGDSNDSILHEDELIQWLKIRLPSTYSINRDESEISAIRLWIR